MVLTRKRSGRNDRGLSARDVKTYSDSSIANVLDVPNLIRSQIESFDWFKTNGLAETFRDCSPHRRRHHPALRQWRGVPTGRAVRAVLPRPLVRHPSVQPGRVPGAGDYLLAAPLRESPASGSGDRRNHRIRHLLRRRAHDDGNRHLHHQRRRAGSGQPAATRARRLLRARTVPGPGLPGVRKAGELVLQGPHLRQPGRAHRTVHLDPLLRSPAQPSRNHHRQR